MNGQFIRRKANFSGLISICIYNTPSDGLLRNKVNYQKYTEVCQ